MKRVTALKLAIVASGRPQRDLALELGLHESQLSRIVNGLETDAGTRYAIADALGRDHDELWPPPERPAADAEAAA
jgi:transcriptional regulator with XRE-family HTH domain